ncbi:hypothetical protein WL27_01870 [Burkholderia multivorans]|uniref:hypothetical protein n=1 Tax=Burkholderia multivorans TaxID=87883 RepID=UPI00075E7D46|nr:hypothetical protein [Burkholderia multivorans]KWA42179.1 hypothetical protein WL27_01870 [Burkholderia multivorans]
MNDKKDQDTLTDEAGAIPLASGPTGKASKKALSSLKREISDDELASPGVQKMILAELDKLEDDKAELSGFRDRFHETNLALAVAREQLKVRVAADTVFAGALTIGALIAGYATSVLDKPITAAACSISGGAMIAIGIVAKVKMK